MTCTLVIQVSCDRLLYFTEDPGYMAPGHPYAWTATHEGPLPIGMTLGNCWNWRYRGGKFIEASEIPAEERGLSRDAVAIVRNKAVLTRLLDDRLSTMLKGLTVLSAVIAPVLYEEAQKVLARSAQPTFAEGSVNPRFDDMAQAQGVTTLELANEIVSDHQLRMDRLLGLETTRRRLSARIAAAKTTQEVEQLRRDIASLR